MFGGRIALKFLGASAERERHVCQRTGAVGVNSALFAPYGPCNSTLQMRSLTEFHSFLLLDETISSQHLIQFSQEVLSDTGQIGTRRTTSLCDPGRARASMRTCICVRGGFGDTGREGGGLVQYDVWRDVSGPAWKERDHQHARHKPQSVFSIRTRKIAFI